MEEAGREGGHERTGEEKRGKIERTKVAVPPLSETVALLLCVVWFSHSELKPLVWPLVFPSFTDIISV